MQNSKYEAKLIEETAQKNWGKHNVYEVKNHAKNLDGSTKPKFYCVSMLPYPSGKLHMGHVRNYTINDVMVRQLRMQGYNVLMPMGWDAFGMPAENAAMSNGKPPAAWTYENIAYMKQQMQSMGLAIDWSREIATCSPEYYKWNQWLFLRMLEQGIVYKKTGTVNWDPIDNTVLANEQVIDGRGWRSGAVVEKRDIPMYYMRITDYADDLLNDLKDLQWPERVKTMQEHWIGKSTGVRFAFTHNIRDSQNQLINNGKLYVFTTRADTIMGVSYCAVAAEHPLAQYAAQNQPELLAFIEECRKGGVAEADIATADKKGMFTGLYVIHPFTGQSIPVWVGNYVLISYGDGAVMGVPAHDERDFAFAKQYNLPIFSVINTGQAFSTDAWQTHYASHGVCINSEFLDGLTHAEAVKAVAKALNEKGLGELKTQFRLRDWGISRQRYWGTPIPIIHCDNCGDVPVPDEQLPVVLPEHLIPDGSGNPLTKDSTFLDCTCPKCGKPARRETDTMDTFVDSSWYFMRYACPDATTMVNEQVEYWMPMDQYIGGIEHAILHLLYSRFWTKVMRNLGLISFKEPATRLLTQGMVLNETFYREDSVGKKNWFNPEDVEVQTDERGRPVSASSRHDGQAVTLGGIEKMSKSKNNGVDPQQLIQQYGADTARLFVMFAAPPEQSLEWSGAGVEGAHRYLRRLYNYAAQHAADISTATAVDSTTHLTNIEKTVRREIHQILQQANFDYERAQYNTVVSAGMKILNTLESAKFNEVSNINTHLTENPGEHQHNDQTVRLSSATTAIKREGFGILLRILYPIVPHITDVLWQELAYDKQLGNLLDAPWPKPEPRALEQDEIDWVIQVNGKLRGTMRTAKNAEKTKIQAYALANENVQKIIGEATVKRIIVVQGKLVNIVI